MRPQDHFFSTNRCAQWIPDVILHPKKYSQAIFLNLAKKLTRPYQRRRQVPFEDKLRQHVLQALELARHREVVEPVQAHARVVRRVSERARRGRGVSNKPGFGCIVRVRACLYARLCVLFVVRSADSEIRHV